MSTKEYKIIVDDGTKKIPITNTFGKLICNIYIRPADFSILDRYDQFNADFSDIVEPLKDVDIKNDGTATFEEDIVILKAVEKELKKRINAVFDMDEADEIFATRNPFSSVNGRFFCMNIIDAIGHVIVEAVKYEMEMSNRRTDKYLSDIQPTATPEVNGDDRTAAADA